MRGKPADVAAALSATLMLLELGRQIPFSKRSSATEPPTLSACCQNGCKCIGFHTGRASMLCAASALRTSSRLAPNWFA